MVIFKAHKLFKTIFFFFFDMKSLFFLFSWIYYVKCYLLIEHTVSTVCVVVAMLPICLATRRVIPGYKNKIASDFNACTIRLYNCTIRHVFIETRRKKRHCTLPFNRGAFKRFYVRKLTLKTDSHLFIRSIAWTSVFYWF